MAKATKTTTKSEEQAAPIDDGKLDYVVTDRAPMKVAGRRVKAGETLRLSEDEARGELLALHITPKVATSEPSTAE
ncbi:hypothetical protein [Rhizobium sp. CECT 9324]|uniref:hypothetical protein n=1 Tax=Rhizobium sp. CECT 9324 TaxID=2845820 RepID=UPI001E4D810D|nr:hypothetical protein [Rhizobium sp. CECT 9324]CAH0339573.1 hypothetical protein RHI9324_01224 [Rhizobium sp. CECT 9324]